MSDDEDVRRTADELVAAFGDHRTADYFACFAPDATFVFYSHPERLETRTAYEDLWARWERDDDFRVLFCESSEQLVGFAGPDVAVFTHVVRTRVRTTAGEETLRERETIVFARTATEHGAPAERPDAKSADGSAEGSAGGPPDGRGRRWLAVHEHLSGYPEEMQA